MEGERERERGCFFLKEGKWKRTDRKRKGSKREEGGENKKRGRNTGSEKLRQRKKEKLDEMMRLGLGRFWSDGSISGTLALGSSSALVYLR